MPLSTLFHSFLAAFLVFQGRLYSELETDLEQAGTSVKLFLEDQSILRALADLRRNPAGFYSRDFLTTAIYRIQRRSEATMQSHDHITILL